MVDVSGKLITARHQQNLLKSAFGCGTESLRLLWPHLKACAEGRPRSCYVTFPWAARDSIALQESPSRISRTFRSLAQSRTRCPCERCAHTPAKSDQGGGSLNLQRGLHRRPGLPPSGALERVFLLLKLSSASKAMPQQEGTVPRGTTPVHTSGRFDAPTDISRLLDGLIAASGGCAVIDGGLATELESRGADLSDPLWSAKCLLDDSLAALVRQVHYDYLKAGADVVISASYQATIQGFEARGFGLKKAEELLGRSVQLACEARDKFWAEWREKGTTVQDPPRSAQPPRQRPLVAASIGSYGAYLADGSEYSGDYGPAMTRDELKEFHRRRLAVLAHSGADLLAIETIPSMLEAQALLELLDEEDVPIPAWLSFNSKDGVNVVRGDSLAACAAAAALSPKVCAVGINCTPPRFILGLIRAVRKVTQKPIVVYPNSGETWDGNRKEWVESTGVTDDDFVSFAPQWRDAGANLLGGCCRTTPRTIRAMRIVLSERDHRPNGLMG